MLYFLGKSSLRNMNSMKNKALIVPLNSRKEIYIQDRRGHKPPPWGFFGGGIEEGETPLQAVIRESKEELSIDLIPEDLEYLGKFPTEIARVEIERTFFVYRTEQTEFTVLEGAGGRWVMLEEAVALLPNHGVEDIIVAITHVCAT